MALPVEVQLAVEALGATAMPKNGEFKLERGARAVYVIPRQTGEKPAVDLAIRIDPGPARGDGYRGDGGVQLPSPPSCEIARSATGGFLSPVETGAPEFDEATAIEVDHPDDAPTLGSMLQSADVRDAVLDLTAAGAKVRLDPGAKAWLTARYEGTSKLGDAEALSGQVERLLALHSALPAFASSGQARGKPGCGCVGVLVLVAAAGFIFAIGTDMSMGSRTGDLELNAVLLSPLLWIAIVALGWMRLRRTGATAFLMGIGLVSLVAAPMTCVAAARLINTVGVSQFVTHRVKVIDKGVTERQRSSDSYWIDVSPWKPHSKPITLGLDPGVHESVSKGDELHVTLGQGRLGHEWVASVGVVQVR